MLYMKINILKLVNKMSIELNTEQIHAVYDMEHWWNSRDHQVFEISGAAGTGKTTLVRYLIERLGLSTDEVLFVAYMGKAASQLSRNGLPAKTIHSAIYDFIKIPARDEDGKIIFKENGRVKTVKKFVLKERIGKNIKLIVLDEGSMVNEEIAKDLLSFDIPIIVLGDLNQLPPVFGNPYFLRKPDVILRKIMRQAEGDPIIWLSQEILAGNKLKPGVYGKSAVIHRSDISAYNFKDSSIVITGTNKLRFNINNYFREELKHIRNLEYPQYGEKVICRKNNWHKMIDDGIYLTNGMTGYIDYIEKGSYNGKTMTMDFRPDFTKSVFKNVTFDYKHLYASPTDESEDNASFFNDKMEFAYAITVHSSQGSQWDKVLFLDEANIMRDPFSKKSFEYTGITRAKESIIIAI